SRIPDANRTTHCAPSASRTRSRDVGFPSTTKTDNTASRRTSLFDLSTTTSHHFPSSCLRRTRAVTSRCRLLQLVSLSAASLRQILYPPRTLLRGDLKRALKRRTQHADLEGLGDKLIHSRKGPRRLIVVVGERAQHN